MDKLAKNDGTILLMMMIKIDEIVKWINEHEKGEKELGMENLIYKKKGGDPTPK